MKSNCCGTSGCLYLNRYRFVILRNGSIAYHRNIKNAGRIDAIGFMERDAKSGNKHGQRVTDTFHLADFFVNNSGDRVTKDGHGNLNWHVSEDLSCLLKIISRNQVVRPEISETANRILVLNSQTVDGFGAEGPRVEVPANIWTAGLSAVIP